MSDDSAIPNISMPCVFTVMLLTLIVLGIAARFYALGSIPPGLNNDEGVYAYYGIRYMTEGHLYLFAQNGFGQETAIGYFFAALAKIFGTSVLLIRLTMTILSSMLVMMFYLLGKEIRGSAVGLLGAALAGGSFLLAFYGRIGYAASAIVLVNCISLYCLLRWSKTSKPIWLILCGAFSVLGLMTYATFRVTIVFLAITCVLLRGGFKRVLWGITGAVVLPGLIYLLCVMISEGTPQLLLQRGLYNLRLPEFSVWENYAYSAMLFFRKPPVEFRFSSGKFLGDGVHQIIHDTFRTPEGFALSAIMLISLCAAVMRCSKWVRAKDTKDPVLILLIWVLLYFLLVGYVGPSYTRLLGVMVPLILLSACTVWSLIEYGRSCSGLLWPGTLLGVLGIFLLIYLEMFSRMSALGKDNKGALGLFDWNSVKMIEGARQRVERDERALFFSTRGIDVMRYLTFDIPYHDTFCEFSVESVQKYLSDGRNLKLYILLENPLAQKLAGYIESNYKQAHSEKFHINETGKDYVELLVAPEAGKK
ncbi:MAG: glycosyltransferase family 39 protein [Candidatus Aureabacteria bacterium]|nr:glycosyltransferase family 39 protein [Candidatus Auribacterota bacterium]